jgi:MoxR-like ATPase
VVPDDVKALAAPVLAHRLVLTPEAELAGRNAEDIIRDVLAAVPVPAPQAKG